MCGCERLVVPSHEEEGETWQRAKRLKVTVGLRMLEAGRARLVGS